MLFRAEQSVESKESLENTEAESLVELETSTTVTLSLDKATTNETLFLADADLSREMPENKQQVDIPKLLDEAEDQIKKKLFEKDKVQ